MVLVGALGALVTFFLLWRKGGLLKHLLIYVVIAGLVGFAIGTLFHLQFPNRGPAWAAAYRDWMAFGIITSVISPLVGMIAAWFNRKRLAASQMPGN